MKVLVTGVSGRIGSEVARQLLAEGHKVTGFDIKLPVSPIDGVEYHRGSLSDNDAVKKAVSTIDSIAHLAAFMSWNPADDSSMLQTNVNGSFALLKTAAEIGISRFVFASTGEVYPEVQPQYLPVDEVHPLEPTSLYGETKVIGEELVRFFQQRKGLPSVILRFPHTQAVSELLNPNSFFSGPRFFLQSKIRQMLSFNRMDVADMLQKYDNGTLQHILQCGEDGESYQMHISDVRDTARGVLLGLTHPDAVGEVFNLTTDSPVVFSEILPKMAEITRCAVVSVNMPGPAVKYRTSNTRIRNKLGYEPLYSFEKMLEEAARFWNRKEYESFEKD